jgi:Spirocyclase AveC-like
MSTVAGPRPAPRTRPEDALASPRRATPVTALAVTGVAFLALIVYVLARWFAGPFFHTVHPPPGSHESGLVKVMVPVSEILSTAFNVPLIWYWIVKPKLKTGSFSLLGLVSLASATVFILDPLQNYFTFGFSYNSHLINWGSWGPYLPGFLTPNMGRWPENPFMAGSTYIWFNFGIPVAFVWLWRRMDRRFPGWSAVRIIVALVGAMAVWDAIMEIAFLHMRVYGYPGADRSLSLFSGHYYQYPIYVGLTTALFWLAMATLVYYVDDRGHSWAERGIDKLRVGPRMRTFVRWLALVGACQVIFIVSYFIPSWFWYAHHSTIPADTPSYMINGACGESAGFPCGGDGVPFARKDGRQPAWLRIDWSQVPYVYSRDPHAPDAPHPAPT